MRQLIVLGLVGFGAQLIDGSLGMGYGVTSTSLLLLAGLTPAAASASVHISELGTNIASGHLPLAPEATWTGASWRGSPDPVRSAPSSVPRCCPRCPPRRPRRSWRRSWRCSAIYILIRFVIGIKPTLKKALTIKFLAPLGLFAGFVDATGGGGWGPVATPALLADGRLEPRKVIGTVDTSEFAVSAAASIGFLIGLGAAGINWGFALALLIGGLIAAPIAAVLVRFAPAHVLGVAVGGIILLTNSRTLLKTFEVETPARFAVYGAILLVTAIGLSIAIQRVRARKRAAAEAAVEESASV